MLKNSFEPVFCAPFSSVVLFDGVLVALPIPNDEHLGFPPFLITKQGIVNASNLSLFNFRVKSVRNRREGATITTNDSLCPIPQAIRTLILARYSAQFEAF